MPAIRRTKTLELFWRLHRWVYKATDGRIGGRLLGHEVLLLTTLGRKSGQVRENTLYYFPYEGSYVVIASNAGAPGNPGWYYNLKALPKATILLRGDTHKVTARDAEGEERRLLWSRVVAQDRSYAEYEQRTERQIPVVILDPEKAH
jgi:deazaflavin-dependent oxidoreductase (nitroreductase family)